jgi:hypothetical protein
MHGFEIWMAMTRGRVWGWVCVVGPDEVGARVYIISDSNR